MHGLDEEIWSKIDDFPNYSVSSHGRILNDNNGRLMKESMNGSGVVKVGLVRGGVQYTRSVKLIVADTFIVGRTQEFDTPIHLDGDARNNRADNLLWRPRWFAWKHTRQFVDITPQHTRGPIVDLHTELWYQHMLEAAVIHGLLVIDIWKSIQSRKETFPTWQVFGFHK